MQHNITMLGMQRGDRFLKFLQNVVNQIKDIVNVEVGVMDDTGIILASTDEKRVAAVCTHIGQILNSDGNCITIQNMTYQKINVRGKLELIAYIAGSSNECCKYLSLIAINIANIRSLYDEKYDKSNFIKSIIMDNILPGDILLKSKELHFTCNVNRAAFLIKTDKTQETHIFDIVQNLFPNKGRDFIIMIDNESIALIKELKGNQDNKEIDKISRVIVDTLNAELLVKARIGIGSIADNIRDIGRSFKEAKMALLIGGIFESEKSIINYNSLGIGRLIYQLPLTLCKLFLEEVFKDNSYESFDSETFITIQKFFENDLNISVASRQLYIHRNTLEYRLKKIERLTGLDLKKFDDAIILKVALMVRKYLDSNVNIV